jgi:ABC-2 type transport system ATP-binding protein
MDPLISTQQLSKKYDAITALEDVTFLVNQGELLALLGPNGVGKTTTIRLLAGLISPSGGSAYVLGQDLTRADGREAVRKQIGILTETPGTYNHLTAYYNLLFFARLYQLAKPAQQVEHFLKLLGLWERRDDVVGSFSKGMKQRLAIARALLPNPKILFLDEPTSGLDPAAARQVRELLQTLKQDGRTILLATHNLPEAEQLADRVALLNRTLITIETPEELSRKLFGSHTRIELHQAAPQYEHAVAALACVASVKSNNNTLSVFFSNPQEDNNQVITTLINSGARIRWVTQHKASLEDVYMSLVGTAPHATTLDSSPVKQGSYHVAY